jgi:hypothetical protein
MKKSDATASGELPLFAWQPPKPQVLPFPLVRRRDLSRKQARYMATLKPSKAAEHLERQLAIQQATLTRYGVAPDQVMREVEALETQIKCELARHLMESGETA